MESIKTSPNLATGDRNRKKCTNHFSVHIHPNVRYRNNADLFWQKTVYYDQQHRFWFGLFQKHDKKRGRGECETSTINFHRNLSLPFLKVLGRDRGRLCPNYVTERNTERANKRGHRLREEREQKRRTPEEGRKKGDTKPEATECKTGGRGVVLGF